MRHRRVLVAVRAVHKERVSRQLSKMAITLIGTLPPLKGISPYTSHLLASLASRPDLEIEFIGFRHLYPRWLYPGGEPAEAGAEPPCIDGVTIRNVLNWYNPLSWLWGGMSLRGTVVHAQWWSYILAPIYLTVLTIAHLRGRRIVLTLHNVQPHEPSWWRRRLNRTVLGLAHHLIVHAEQNRATLVGQGRDPNSVTALPMGTHHVSMSGVGQADAREKLGIQSGRPILLHFGNIRPYKGLDVLLRALALVRKEMPNVVLLVAGRPWGDWTSHAHLISSLDLDRHVLTHLDFVPTRQVETYFAAADLVVLPYTHFDAQSAVGALALSFGKAMVVTEVGGLPELVGDDRAVVPANDPSALADTIARVLTDAKLRSQLEKRVRQRARQLDWRTVANATVDVYRRVIDAT